MRADRLTLLLFAGLTAGSAATAGDEPSRRAVLFIGNSLIFTNDLPAVFARVARAVGDTVAVHMVAGPNLAVVDHTDGATDALAQIHRNPWRFVMLQQGPTPAGVCRDTLVIAAMRFGPYVRAAGGRVALFLPWTRRDRPADLEGAAESGRAAAGAVGGLSIPVGLAWKLALEADPALPLYGPDGYHPAPAGTLLAALTIYDRMFSRDVREIPAAMLAELSGGSLSPAQRELLTASAHAAAAGWPADSATPVPADTTLSSPGGGPC